LPRRPAIQSLRSGRRNGASLLIVQKRVDLINCDSAFEAMAVPI
jgi:hypothetical protein